MKTRLAVCLALFAALGLLLTGCAWGFVTDADTGEPVEGASVVYVDSQGDINAALTGGGGLYRFDAFEGNPIPSAGTAMFMILAPGYETLVVERTIRYDDNDAGTWEVQSFELARATPTPMPTVTSTPTVTATATPTATSTPTATATP